MSAAPKPWAGRVGVDAARILAALEEWGGGEALLGQLRQICRQDRAWQAEGRGFERAFAVAFLEALVAGLLAVETELDHAGQPTGEQTVRLQQPEDPR